MIPCKVMNKKFSHVIVVAITTLFLHTISFAQTNHDYSYLLKCFSNPAIDSFKTAIDGIGEIESINYSSDNVESGLSFFDIPQNKQSKSIKKLAQVAASRHIQTWKNNSRIVLNKQYTEGTASIVDLRFHLLIEDIYMQVIIICENKRIYELTTFRDTGDKTFFNILTEKVRMKKCL